MKGEKKQVKSLMDWLAEFYDDTSKISELNRNLAFAGIGLIWIFKNTETSNSLIPIELHCPLKFLILSLFADLVQYLWRAISIYINYRIFESKYLKKIISDNDLNNIVMPRYISNVTWLFFVLKLSFIVIAYYRLLIFLTYKI